MHSPKRNSGSFNPGPSYMNQEEMREYLRNLRSNRPTRPPVSSDSDPRASVSSFKSSTDSRIGHSSSLSSHKHCLDTSSSTQSPERQSSFSYLDRERRQLEMSEARRLRMALDQQSFEDPEEEHRVHAAAQQQASQLIHKHRNPDAPYSMTMPPPPPPPTNAPTHTDKKSFNLNRLRSQKSDISTRNPTSPSPDVISPDLPNIKKRSSYSKLANYWNNSGLGQRRRSSGSRRSLSGKNNGVFANPDDKIYEDPTDRVSSAAETVVPHGNHQASASQSSLLRKNPFARAYSVKAQPAADDLPWPHQQQHSASPSRDFARPSHGAYDVTEPAGSEPVRYKNNQMEIRSDEIRAATSARRKDRSHKLPSPSAVSDNPERPIVSFEPGWVPEEESTTLQAAQDRRESSSSGRDSNLPRFEFPPSPSVAPRAPSPRIQVTPTAPGERVERQKSKNGNVPSITIGDNISSSSGRRSDNPKKIYVRPDIDPTPTAAENRDGQHREPENKASKYRYSAFPSPQHSPTHSADQITSRPHITPTRRVTALCAQCALPISGRIVSAAGLRFHPECFTCFHCGEGLECIDFYPEPAAKRESRLDRIQRRMDGELIDELPGATEADDGDDSLRFYCHLDFHELFSPRCKSCKTPIEGEVVVACGAEWHVGHFFCAQCGDPFDQNTPFVEKDGYAWCVECHTHRYSAKCKKCRRPVTNTVIQALGAEWHSECFCCTQCGGAFEGGRFFLRSGTQDPVCLACEQKRLKA